MQAQILHIASADEVLRTFYPFYSCFISIHHDTCPQVFRTVMMNSIIVKSDFIDILQFSATGNTIVALERRR